MAQFPMISRQMQGGLEKIMREFVAANEKPIAKKDIKTVVGELADVEPVYQ